MEQWYKCPRCGKDVLYGTNPCPYCRCPLAWSRQGPVQYLPPAAQPEPVQQPQQTPQHQQQHKAEPPKTKLTLAHKIAAAIVLLGLGVFGTCAICICTTPTEAPPPATTPTEPTPSTTEQTPSNTEPTPSTAEPAPEPTPTPSPYFTEARVTRVIDGDTIEVSIAGETHTVRYIGVDTPETVHPTEPVEYMGQEASDKNKELVGGKTVGLEKDVSETDKYGRLLRYVYLGDLFVNAELVRLGYAQVSTYPPDVKYQDLFLQLQQEARDAGRGLWASQPPTQEPEQSSGKYVGSIKSNKYHYPWCSAAKKILPENLIWFDSAADAQSQGYVPCKICTPPLND
jgi:micrococcal nuclease